MSENETKKGPSHIAYQVNEGEEGKSYFNKVGSAFAHKDGKGFSIILDSVPVNGRVTLRTPQERAQSLKEGKREVVGKDEKEAER